MVALELNEVGLAAPDHSWISPGFAFRPKQAVPGDPIVCDDLFLKWYDLVEANAGVNGGASEQARQFVAWVWDGQPSIGWGIHHPCEGGTYVTASRWEDNNELWEQIWWLADGETTFRALKTRDGLHHTHCLWQLGIVAHEAEAWATYLQSDHDGEAIDQWIANTYEGLVP